MNTKPIILYKQDNNGKIRQWSIQICGEQIIIMYGEKGGSLQTQTEDVPEGKGGRTQGEQIMSRVASRISNQRDRGYTNSLEKAKAGRPTNTLNLPMPMLAQKYKGVMPSNAIVQRKYDGNRCIITKQQGVVFAYSRKGKIFENIQHILDAAKDIPEGSFIDGELYHHGTPLQTIRSWISRKQAENNNLIYICYDAMLPVAYTKRLLWLLDIEMKYPIQIAYSLHVDEDYNLIEDFKQARKDGYEGLIIRDANKSYEDGKRSAGLLKVKSTESQEYLVIDIIASADGWAILECETPHGKTFKVSCHGPVAYKTEVLENKLDFIGRRVTVEFANLTKEKIPFHPVAIAWRGIDDV